MIKIYLKQALYQLQENKLLSFISIAGTAMAIAMIMVMVIVQRVGVKSYSPEENRDRTLHVKWMTVANKKEDGTSNGPMALRTAKECFKDLTTPEAVCVYSPIFGNHLATVQGGDLMSVDMLQTDEAFWTVFEFPFLSGKPYDLADCESGLAKAVITVSVARKLFGTTDVVGRTMSIDHSDYTVCGVVKDVSQLASTAYAQVWVPYSSTNIADAGWGGVMGAMRVVMLARSADDFPAIREEAERLRLKFNASLDDKEIRYRDQPDTQFVYNHRKWANVAPNVKGIIIQFIVVISLLLLVPAINLSGMTLSRMRKRYPELGVRRSFGATRGELLNQILLESMVLTLIGGFVGLLLSFGSIYVLNDMLFANSENSFLNGVNAVSLSTLFDPVLFLGAFLFCLLLNLLSSGVPAWRASRQNIVNALNS